MTGTTGDWSAALDQFEQRLVEFRSVLDDGRPATGLWPPPDLVDVPFPPEQADRARTLLALARELEGELVAKRDALPAPRPAGKTRRTTPHSSFLTEL
ncbi:MAG: hypothetical protein ACR2QK_14665 [Acidimicrobiales bacterium]